jgi:hypothetical protein
LEQILQILKEEYEKNLDKFELYALRNILYLPNEIDLLYQKKRKRQDNERQEEAKLEAKLTKQLSQLDKEIKSLTEKVEEVLLKLFLI